MPALLPMSPTPTSRLCRQTGRVRQKHRRTVTRPAAHSPGCGRPSDTASARTATTWTTPRLEAAAQPRAQSSIGAPRSAERLPSDAAAGVDRPCRGATAGRAAISGAMVFMASATSLTLAR